jgi:hypothetical protein
MVLVPSPLTGRAYPRNITCCSNFLYRWIWPLGCQTIPWIKCFGRIPRRMPFLGAETALGCVGGRQVGIIPPSLAPSAKTGGGRGKRLPGMLEAGFYRPAAAGFRHPIGPT